MAGLVARRHLAVETPEGAAQITLGQVAEFVESCREAGIPYSAVLSSPGGDVLRRLPIQFSVTWTEEL